MRVPAIVIIETENKPGGQAAATPPELTDLYTFSRSYLNFEILRHSILSRGT